MDWCVEKGLMNGVSKTRFAPEDSMTRAEAAAMFMRFAHQNRINLGDSGLCVYAPVGFRRGADEMSEYQLGYYCRGENEVDFDTYEWVKDAGATAQSEAEAEAAEYDNCTVNAEVFRGIDIAWYETIEEADGESYRTLTYIFDVDPVFAEPVFRMDGE